MSPSPKGFHPKSRNGCLRCKARKVKCDENKPICGRCEVRGLECPGYALNVRWSKKHEVRAGRLLSQGSIQTVPQQRTPIDHLVLNRPSQTLVQENDGEPWNLPNQWSSAPHVIPCHADVTDAAVLMLGAESIASPVATWDCPDLDGMVWSDIEGSLPSTFSIIEQPSSPQNTQIETTMEDESLASPPGVTSQTVISSQPPVLRQVQEVPRQILHVPTALSEYFFSQVIPLYCVWDSKLNTMRNIVESMWQSSGALHHTIQSMAAACLSESFPHLLEIAQQEHTRALGCITNKPTVPAQRSAMALAATFLGHTSSWISPNNLAPDMYQTSCSMLDEIARENEASASSFFRGTMDYWAMLLAFLTDSQQLDTSERNSASFPASQARRVEPHPYCGISHSIIKTLRDTGILIFSYRKKMSKISFMTEEHADTFKRALSKARRLERLFLSHRLPSLSHIEDPGDPQTPLKHLQLMDEAYRYTGLLQLYRVFPDLLNERYEPWDKDRILQPVPGTKIPTSKERQNWLNELSLHVIDILEDIPFESGTRSAQPFIMVAVSSELVLDSQQTPLNDAFESLNQLPFRVAKARKFLASRLAAYTHILPLQKTKAISQLINHIWAALDAGEQQVYWLDVAYEKKMGTMFG
ncbi:c6 zinc finger domain [Fusarium longipes]|uniref:C6 zinc finger domain n=1 Tax=Fusarium longipes TaxID=694270 RepID=A0A395SXG7_9HYPO|nr:c6 zinc finger domain [Fusarium longipes]